MVWTIYHNPGCSKSRASLALLHAHGIDPVVVNYLEQAPDQATLHSLLSQLQLPIRALLRDNEPVFAALVPMPDALADAELITLICQHPVLLQRPIVSNGQRAVIGRPPENLLPLLHAG